MLTVSIKDAKSRLSALARLVEKGATVVVTRNGKPILNLVPHREKAGLNFEAVSDFKREQGIDRVVTRVADDFDAPLSEDVLVRPQL